MPQLSPIVRITIGLVMLSFSILVFADLIGLIENPNVNAMKARAAVSETLAIQLSATPTRETLPVLRHTLRRFIDHREDVVGVGISRSDGTQLLWFGEARDETPGNHMPSSEFFEVPLYLSKQLWGTVQVLFRPINEGWMQLLTRSSWSLFVLFPMACAAFFYLFLRKSLRELDPSQVVPERVRSALDSLSQGLIILDTQEHIVLANEGMAKRLGLDESELLGKRIDSLAWNMIDPHKEAPWKRSLNHDETVTNVAVRYDGSPAIEFNVSCVPITTPAGKVSGAMLTFDDMTAVNKRNRELQSALTELRRSQDEISDKSRKLEFLATHDPLTECLNRRAFMDKFEAAFALARRDDQALSCVMVDIDHFKRINDKHGHAVGDRVICHIANVLKSNTRENDHVGRYGGEEFCIFFPNADLEQAVGYAERIRRAINIAALESGSAGTPLIPVAASLGVAELMPDITGTGELLDLADQALYRAKRLGRNQVRTPESQTSGVQLVDEEHVPEQEDVCVEDDDQVSELRKRIQEMEGLLNARTNEIWEHSLHDSLTGLPNRVLLTDRTNRLIKRCDRTNTSLGAVLLQIRDVHRINQMFGHGAGDELLVGVASRLASIADGTDTAGLDGAAGAHTVSRVGGNDFAILISDLPNPEVSTRILSRVQKALTAPFNVAGEEVLVAARLGVSLYPQDANDAETLLKTAAVARASLASDRHRIAIAYFSPDLNKASTRRLMIETLLPKALESDEFEIHFQPKLRTDTGRITGVEALARWNSASLGSVSPAEFVPIAEQTGLSTRLTKTVLKQVSRELRKWRQLNIEDVRVAINLSSTEFQDPNYAEWLLDTINVLDIDPGSLEIEVTESSFVDDYESGLRILTTLKNNGLVVAMDDFGTGYSSLSQLKELPFDCIKIDACFIREIDLNHENHAIVQAVIGMARNLGMNVVAEGVETKAEHSALADLGCPEVQGYLTCRPLPGNEVTEFLLSYAHMTDELKQEAS
ncbi:MAG: diguanylate cyclase [Gammaproteobacteria bacterium]|nr:diguanylate cyclase [Gammaproteobacteria bacterium]